MSSVLYLFLTHLGLGIAGSLLLVGRAAGAQFFRFNSGLASTLLLIGLAFRQEPTASGSFDAVGFGAQLVATGALLIYWASIGRGLSALRPYLLWATFLGGIISLVAQGVGLSGGEIAFAPALTAVSFLSSAALLGGTCTAMILGHWYLVLPSMDVALLQSIVKFHIGSTVARAAVVVTVVWVALVTWSAPWRKRREETARTGAAPTDYVDTSVRNVVAVDV